MSHCDEPFDVDFHTICQTKLYSLESIISIPHISVLYLIHDGAMCALSSPSLWNILRPFLRKPYHQYIVLKMNKCMSEMDGKCKETQSYTYFHRYIFSVWSMSTRKNSIWRWLMKSNEAKSFLLHHHVEANKRNEYRIWLIPLLSDV